MAGKLAKFVELLRRDNPDGWEDDVIPLLAAEAEEVITRGMNPMLAGKHIAKIFLTAVLKAQYQPAYGVFVTEHAPAAVKLGYAVLARLAILGRRGNGPAAVPADISAYKRKFCKTFGAKMPAAENLFSAGGAEGRKYGARYACAAGCTGLAFQ